MQLFKQTFKLASKSKYAMKLCFVFFVLLIVLVAMQRLQIGGALMLLVGGSYMVMSCIMIAFVFKYFLVAVKTRK